MREEFIKAIELAAEKLHNSLLQQAHVDWAQSYSRIEMNPTEAKELAARYINNFMAQENYLFTSKNLLK